MELSKYVFDNLGNPDVRFVFPSELTARFWCKRALQRSPCKSIPQKRFLSWDQFKESCLVYPPPDRPVNRALRLLFLHGELEKNSIKPFLRRIVPPRFSRDYIFFLEPLQRLLPVLHRLDQLRSSWPSFSAEKLQDLDQLYTRYRNFLERSHLYEPNFRRPEFSPGSATYILFFPELIEDYPEFADLLSDEIRTIPAPKTVRRQASIEVFETLPDEIRTTIQRIAALLDNDNDAAEVILTVGNLSEVEPLLRREAELFALPLQIHLGKALSEFPQIRLFRRLFEAVQSDFSLDAMKDLLLCRSIPWKQEDLCRSLIRLALDARILGTTAGRDNWELSIETARRNRNPRNLPLSRISAFFSTLKDALRRIATAATFAGLKKNLVAFTSNYLDLSCLNEDEQKIYQFAMDTFDELGHAAELVAKARGSYGAGGDTRSTPSPHLSVFPLWWLYLGQRLYVPGRYNPGISVLPFRVSEGMDPQHHFVINASQAATRHTLRRYPFLKAHEEQGLPEVQRELSAAHLQLYSHSGKKVMFSYARRDYQRSNLPPPVFLTQGISEHRADTVGSADIYELERRGWSENSSFPLQVMQADGYRAASVGALGVKEFDAATHILQDDQLSQVLGNRLRDREERLRISATALESFSSCPFQFLFERLLGIGGEDFQPTMIDPIDFGLLLHRVVENFFNNTTPVLSQARREEYRGQLEAIISGICRKYRRKNPTLLAPIGQEIQRRIAELIFSFLDAELEVMVGEELQGCEVPLAAAGPGGDTLLVGKIDRLSRNADGYTLIDYKKKYLPKRGELFSEHPPSLQMPFYIHVMDRCDLGVTKAAYYSFQNKRYRFVFGAEKGNMGSLEDIHRSIEVVQQCIGDMVGRIAEGDYRIGISGTPGCSRCRLQGICRYNYTLEG